MTKSREAFRTISEVAEWLDTPAHVLRFWETKFAQVKPVKRAGGRRYYRPEDMALLGGIKTLLHEDGMTIKGVQKLLRERGVRHVAALGPAPVPQTESAILPDPGNVLPLPRGTDAPLPGTAEAGRDAAQTVLAAAQRADDGAGSGAAALDILDRPLPDTDPAGSPAAPDEDIAAPGPLAALARLNAPALRRRAAHIAPLLRQLEALRDRIGRKG